MLEHITLKEDYSDRLKFIHQISVKSEDQNIIIWPPSRAGEKVEEVKQ